MNNDITPENNQNVTPETNQAPTPAAANAPYQQNPQQGQQTYQQPNFQQPNFQQNQQTYQQPNFQQQTYQNQGQYNNPYPGVQQNFYTQNTTYVDESGLFSENKLARLNGTSATIKVGDWLKADCISFLSLIPCIGSIAAIVIYFILAFSSKTAKSLKNRYVASLIWAAIILVLYIIVFAIVAAAGVSLAGMFSDYWNEIANL